MRRFPRALCGAIGWIGAIFGAGGRTLVAAEVPAVVVDCSKTIGHIRPLHGGADGPIQFGGLVDLSKEYRALAIPQVRLHDCRWPNADVVDFHVVFPNLKADPALPASYDFARTDACIESVSKTGASMIYRLGESIEHTPRQYHVNPPADMDKWAAACVGIIRHYNEGWADGPRSGIRYWEIWNEPENRPRCWTGTDDDYFHLYEKTATAIKSRWPDLKVGGPSLGYTGKIVDGRFEPGEFLLKFLNYCKGRSLPLDFFSWHLYGNDPAEYLLRARGIREVLNRSGFDKTELHLNEWNYLPDNRWLPFTAETQGTPRERYFERVTGVEGAAFVGAVLTTLQDSPVDVANFFATNTQPMGLFSVHGAPHKTFYAFKAFRVLLETPERLPARGDAPAFFIGAGTNADRSLVQILVSNRDPVAREMVLTMTHIPWKGGSTCQVNRVDAANDLEAVSESPLDASDGRIVLKLSGPSISLLKIRPRS